MGRAGSLGGILLLAWLHNPAPALGATLPGDSVALAWDASPSSEVTGYRVYYGAASGNYTNSVVVGSVTTTTISGLASGVTYFFALSAYNADGLESTLSSEIGYTVPKAILIVRIGITPAKQAVLTVTGLSGHT